MFARRWRKACQFSSLIKIFQTRQKRNKSFPKFDIIRNYQKSYLRLPKLSLIFHLKTSALPLTHTKLNKKKIDFSFRVVMIEHFNDF